MIEYRAQFTRMTIRELRQEAADFRAAGQAFNRRKMLSEGDRCERIAATAEAMIVERERWRDAQ